MQSFHNLYIALLVSVSSAVMLLTACKEKLPPRAIEPSFYYWKSTLNLDERSLALLGELHIKRLYVKFFDVAWNEHTRQPMPVAVVKFRKQAADFKKLAVIPTVFITNGCIEKMDSTQVDATAQRIFMLITQICNLQNLPVVPEIQVDCDWNATTKNKYFALLYSMRRFTTAASKQLSATIRLYQCRYAARAGVPPVDRGLLMCYNMGNLKNPSTANSILEAGELKKYISGLNMYPLPLDLALPLFGWKVLFRNNKYRGLISELPTSWLAGNPAIKRAGNRYTIVYDTTLGGYNLKTGDILRDEQVEFDEVIKAADLLALKLKSKRLAVSLYHLDSLTLSKFSVHELETIFVHLR